MGPRLLLGEQGEASHRAILGQAVDGLDQRPRGGGVHAALLDERLGLGRELGRQGLDAFRRSKMVIIDHKPAIQEWWYPYPDGWFRATGGRKHV